MLARQAVGDGEGAEERQQSEYDSARHFPGSERCARLCRIEIKCVPRVVKNYAKSPPGFLGPQSETCLQ